MAPETKELQADELAARGMLPHPDDVATMDGDCPAEGLPPWRDDAPPPDDWEAPGQWGEVGGGAPAHAADEAKRAAEREAARAARLEALRGDRVGAFLGDALDEMRGRGSGAIRPVPVPWERTAKELRGGLWPGCYVLVGATGAGKTQWAFEVAYHAITQPSPVPVLYIGLELDRPGLVARLAALGLRKRGRPVSWSGFYMGERAALAELDKPEGREVLEGLDAAPLYLVTGDARGWPYSKLGEAVDDIRAEHPTGPVLVILDFLQLVSGADDTNQREDIRERIGGAAYLARMAARKHGATVLILSATARNNYPLFTGTGKVDGDRAQPLGVGDPGRFVGTGKEAGEVEYAADGVLALCRAPDGPNRLSWIAVAKARTGRPSDCKGWIAYGFDGTCFKEDIDATDKPPPDTGSPSGPGAGGGGSRGGKGRAFEGDT